jgi:tetratricopeptide (TPR) repeat protein
MEELGFPDRHHLLAAEGWLGLGDAMEAESELALLEIEWRIHSHRLDWEKALDAARCCIEAAPHLPAGWIHQSYSLHELGRTKEAFQSLHAIVLKFPDESVIPYNLACYSCQMGDLEAARRWFDQAVRIGGKATIKEMAEDDPDLEPLLPYIESL